MKILLVSNLYPSKRFPFFGSFVGEFAKGITKCGANVIHKAVIDRKTKNIVFKIWLYLCLYAKILFYGLFTDYDIIYVHYIAHVAFPIYIISLFRKKIVVLNVHGDDILPRTKLVSCFQPIIQLLLNRTSLVVLPSLYFKDIFLSRFKFPIKKLFISPSGGIDLELFKNISESKEKLNIPRESFVVGYISRIDEGKGWDTFIDSVEEVYKRIPNLRAIIIGNGLQMEDLKNRCTNIPYIDIHKNISHTDLSLYYSALDIFVFPTKLRESLGLVGLEAMACGVPVIGSNIGGLPTYIKHGTNGYLFNPGDSDTLAKNILNYFRLDDNEKKRYIQNALSTANNYESNRIMQLLYDKLQTLIDTRACHRCPTTD